ncbi:sulfotransferase domain-containing protein [Tateyamaria sp. SN3-11]|uniref:sulfotransferase domain-containing protein n=1 Tax=Tateyamaria sp. SN3-11 TaxID=3092147 RepID=UPI0039EC94F9
MLTPPRPRARIYPGRNVDPTRWDRFVPRAGDVVVSTPSKSGTTWVQGILALLFSGDVNVDPQLSTRAPWLDIAEEDWADVAAALDAQTSRRQIKTHTPLDGAPLWPDVRYICVFRHPIDVHLSFRAHVYNMRKEVLRHVFPEDVREGFHLFLQGDAHTGSNLASILDHYRAARALDEAPNVLRLHYADMLRDLPGAVARIADHAGIHHEAALLSHLVEAARFNAMKANAARFAVAAGQGFWHDDACFFHSGGAQKWQGVLEAEDIAAYEARMAGLLSAEARHWLEWGAGAA